MKYGFEDLAIATKDNFDNCYDFVVLNGVDYLCLCESLLNNKHVNRFVSMIVKNLSQFEDLLPHLMNRRCIRMLLTLMSERTVRDEMQICINSGGTLAEILLLGSETWDRYLSDLHRQSVLQEFRLYVLKWKPELKSELQFDSLKDVFEKLKSDKSSPEVSTFFIWILAHLIQTDLEKYAPMIDKQNGIEYLQTLYESPKMGSNCRRNLEFVVNKCSDWKKNQQRAQSD